MTKPSGITATTNAPYIQIVASWLRMRRDLLVVTSRRSWPVRSAPGSRVEVAVMSRSRELPVEAADDAPGGHVHDDRQHEQHDTEADERRAERAAGLTELVRDHRRHGIAGIEDL